MFIFINDLMAYLFREKFKVSDLAVLQQRPDMLVLIMEPEDYLRELYAKHFSDNDIKVVHCTRAEELFEHVRISDPQLLLVNIDALDRFSRMLGLLKLIKASFNHLPVVAISGGLDADGLKELMDIGISSHIDRRFTRPADVVHVVKAILNN